MLSVRDAIAELRKKKVTVFGISTDPVEKQRKFAEENKLSYQLLSDSDGKLAKALGVPLKFGGRVMGRQAFLFKDGKLVWKDEKARPRDQGQKVLQVLAQKDGL